MDKKLKQSEEKSEGPQRGHSVFELECDLLHVSSVDKKSTKNSWEEIFLSYSYFFARGKAY